MATLASLRRGVVFEESPGFLKAFRSMISSFNFACSLSFLAFAPMRLAGTLFMPFTE